MKISLLILMTLALIGLGDYSRKAIADQGSFFEGHWKFQNERGESEDFSKLKGHSIMATMAYTACKMQCPLIIRQLRKIQGELSQSSDSPQILFITIDPIHDTPRKLNYFETDWDLSPSYWHFLTGTKDETRRMAKWLGIHFEEIDDHFIHDSKIVIINKTGVVVKTLEGWNSINKESL